MVDRKEKSNIAEKKTTSKNPDDINGHPNKSNTTERRSRTEYFREKGQFFGAEVANGSAKAKCRLCRTQTKPRSLRIRHIVCGAQCFKTSGGFDSCGRWCPPCFFGEQRRNISRFITTNSEFTPVTNTSQLAGISLLPQKYRVEIDTLIATDEFSALPVQAEANSKTVKKKKKNAVPVTSTKPNITFVKAAKKLENLVNEKRAPVKRAPALPPPKKSVAIISDPTALKNKKIVFDD
ncbi:hypothetical protein HK100_011250 [Physocladia obscura]|uniref:Uncharacterized protein n=1 Tax=Physocladia obscura TaxID=109957 RepID=A0AAD5T4F9_9FUNG|nr:hypothetical protein HK100_011250 [Physocladia obscura]